MERLYTFIDHTCSVYGIDPSHGRVHSERCIRWAEYLLAGEQDVSEDERILIVYGAALHDMCDSKYTDIVLASDRIREWLCDEGWSEALISALLAIITTMSYSKLKQAAVGGVPVFPNHGPWQRAYHIIRHADLLDAYKASRCYLYQKHICAYMSDGDCWKKVYDLMHTRVFRYISDEWIFLPRAYNIVPHLIEDAQRCMKSRDISYVVVDATNDDAAFAKAIATATVTATATATGSK